MSSLTPKEEILPNLSRLEKTQFKKMSILHFFFNKRNLCHSSNAWLAHQSFHRGTVSSLMPSLVTMQILRASLIYTSLSAAEMKTTFTSLMALSRVRGTCSTFCICLKPTWVSSRGYSLPPERISLVRAQGQSCTHFSFLLHLVLQ